MSHLQLSSCEKARQEIEKGSSNKIESGYFLKEKSSSAEGRSEIQIQFKASTVRVKIEKNLPLPSLVMLPLSKIERKNRNIKVERAVNRGRENIL